MVDLITADFKPIPLNIELVRGDSPIIPLRLTSGGVALPLAGAVITWTVGPEENPSDNTGQLFQVGGVLVSGGTSGEFTLQPTTGDTGALTAGGEYFHDIRMVLAAYGDRTIFKGQVIVIQDINKDA